MKTTEMTSDIENIEIRTALDMFFEQSHELAKSAVAYSNYCGGLPHPVVPDTNKYLEPGGKLLEMINIGIGAYREANVLDRGGLDKRMMELVTSCVNDVVRLREDLNADFTKLHALNAVSEAKTSLEKNQRIRNKKNCEKKLGLLFFQVLLVLLLIYALLSFPFDEWITAMLCRLLT